MSKRFAILLVVLLSTCLSVFAVMTDSNPLIPFRDGDKWGYSNAQKTIIIPCTFVEATPFEYGLGLVKDENDEWHTVSMEGQIGKPISAEEVFLLSSSLLCYTQNGKYGLMTTKGKALTKCVYDEFIIFYDDAPATWVKKDGFYGAINTKGKEVIKPQYPVVSGPQGGALGVKKEGLYALYTTKGKAITRFLYNQVNLLSEDVFTVQEGKNWKILNKEGRTIRDFGDKYSFIGGFESGLARASIHGKWGFINHKGEEIIPLKYATCGSLGEGLFTYGEENFDVIVDKTGKVVRKDIAGVSSFVNHRAIINQNGKVGMMAPDGKTVIPCKYDQIDDFFIGDYTTAENEGKKIILDINGKECLISPYEKLEARGNGLFMVFEEDGTAKGYIDYKGTQYWKD